MNLSRDEQLALLSLKQPDSLKLTARLAILKWFHAIATQIEDRFGDKAADKKLFLPGVQVSKLSVHSVLFSDSSCTRTLQMSDGN